MKTFRTTADQPGAWHAPVAGAALLAIVACASAPMPLAELAVARAAVSHAAAAGGPEFAPAEMTMARDKMARAEVALQADRRDHARELAQQAQVDAQLAEARAEARKAERSATSLQEAARALNDEMARQPK